MFIIPGAYRVIYHPTDSTIAPPKPAFFFNPFRAPEPLPILNPSNVVPKNGFPVVKGLTNVSWLLDMRKVAIK